MRYTLKERSLAAHELGQLTGTSSKWEPLYLKLRIKLVILN
jgi:hypothetical protein